MSIFSNFFKKEAPLLGLQGSGGGLGFLAGRGAAGPGTSHFYEFKVWGAGGGGGASHRGGGGAYVNGQYEISNGTTITLVVGCRGHVPTALNTANYGGGGPKGTTYPYPASGGAGLSGVFLTSSQVYTPSPGSPFSGAITPAPTAAPHVQPGQVVANTLIIAAGGGGAAYDGNAGGGGITTGGNGDPIGGATRGTGATWGGAGTDTGAGGGGGNTGGRGYGGRSSGGGGGGSGFYGGGAGNNGNSVAAGGGGSSYYWTTQTKPPAFVSYNPGSINTAAGANGGPGGVAGNASDPLNNSSYGGAGYNNNSGQNGLIAYRVSDTSYDHLAGQSWTTVTHTGSDQTITVPS